MRNRNGFTILELVVAMAIIGIMVALATTNLFTWREHYAAIDFRQEIFARCNEARARAMASNHQHMMAIDITAGTVTVLRGDAGTGSTNWTTVGNPAAAARGTGIHEVRADGFTFAQGDVARFWYNPGGQVMIDNTSDVVPLTVATIQVASEEAKDQATVRIFGWTSKARMENGWNH